MVFKPQEPIRIDKSFAFKSVQENTDSVIPFITIRGYASRMFDANGEFVIDADRENIDTMGIGLSRLKSGNLPLLYGHDQSKPVGKITAAAYKPDGLEIEATLYKLPGDDLTNFVYESVKVGTLNSFSVGILVEEFDMIEKDGGDYLQLSKSEMIETSIVAVPSNNEATFGIMEMKGIKSPIISKAGLKAENPNICGKFETCVLESTKALDYDDTKQESWMTRRQFSVYLDSLVETLVDNFDANMWDELSATSLVDNMELAFAKFIEDQKDLINGNEKPMDEVNELNEALAHDGSFAFADNAKSINGENMHIKDVEETPVVTPEVPVKEVETEVVPTKEEAPVVDSPVVVEEPAKEEPVVTEPKKEETPEVEIASEERTLDDFIADNAVMGANLTNLSLEDLEKVYNSIGSLSANIADFVTTQVQEEQEAQVADKTEA